MTRLFDTKRRNLQFLKTTFRRGGAGQNAENQTAELGKKCSTEQKGGICSDLQIDSYKTHISDGIKNILLSMSVY